MPGGKEGSWPRFLPPGAPSLPGGQFVHRSQSDLLQLVSDTAILK
jgi:hypothetical protein